MKSPSTQTKESSGCGTPASRSWTRGRLQPSWCVFWESRSHTETLNPGFPRSRTLSVCCHSPGDSRLPLPCLGICDSAPSPASSLPLPSPSPHVPILDVFIQIRRGVAYFTAIELRRKWGAFLHCIPISYIFDVSK